MWLRKGAVQVTDPYEHGKEHAGSIWLGKCYI
jgi:hypothetical protein